jgi:DNA-binding MarR family transcriptional regulator
MRETEPSSKEALLRDLEREIRKLSAQSVLFSQAVAERVGINSSDLECLDIIVLRGTVTAGELAAATGLTTGAITGVIDRLEKGGFARRERDTEDRRRVLVRPLPEVDRRIAPLYHSLQQSMTALWSRYSAQELALIIDFLASSYPICCEETARLRAGAAPSGQDARSGPAER